MFISLNIIETLRSSDYGETYSYTINRMLENGKFFSYKYYMILLMKCSEMMVLKCSEMVLDYRILHDDDYLE